MEKKLIEFVRKNSLFYDKTHILYRNQTAREEKWMELSKDIGVPAEALKKRWKSLRDRFFRISKSSALEKKSYKYYRSLRFLLGHERESYKIKSSISTDDDLSKNEDSFLLDAGSFSPLHENATVSITCEETPAKNQIRKRKKNDPVEENPLKDSIKIAAFQNTTPFRAFLESIALTVENANLNIMEVMHLQMDILQIVHTKIQNHNYF